MREDEEPDVEERLRLDRMTVEGAYEAGYVDGQNDFRKHFRKEISKVIRARDRLDSILREPEKLIELSLRDKQIESAIVTAVVSMLLAEQETPKAKGP